MLVYVKAEVETARGKSYFSVSMKAISSLHGLRKFENYLCKTFGFNILSMESSDRQHYTSLVPCYPLVSINHKHVMHGSMYVESYDKQGKRYDTRLINSNQFI